MLGRRFRLSTPTLNLGAAVSEISERYRDHLIWAQDPERYEIIIAGLRSAKMRELIDWDKSNRYAVSLQNRLFKGFQGLALMNEQERISKAFTLTQEQKSAEQAPIELEGVCVSEAS